MPEQDTDVRAANVAGALTLLDRAMEFKFALQVGQDLVERGLVVVVP